MLEHVNLDFEKRSREDWEQDNGSRGKGRGWGGVGLGVGLENTLQEILKDNKIIIMNINYRIDY